MAKDTDRTHLAGLVSCPDRRPATDLTDIGRRNGWTGGHIGRSKGRGISSPLFWLPSPHRCSHLASLASSRHAKEAVRGGVQNGPHVWVSPHVWPCPGFSRSQNRLCQVFQDGVQGGRGVQIRGHTELASMASRVDVDREARSRKPDGGLDSRRNQHQ